MNDMNYYQLNLKTAVGGAQVWTGDLSICSRMLYHWAIPPTEISMPPNLVLHSLLVLKHKRGGDQLLRGTAGVMVSFKIPILETWVWFPGSACFQSFCSEKKTEIVVQKNLFHTITQGSARIWTRDLSICSRMLYHWATPPLQVCQYAMNLDK